MFSQHPGSLGEHPNLPGTPPCHFLHPLPPPHPCTAHSLEHRFFPPPELSTSVLPLKGSSSSTGSSFWSELQCCHGVICLPVHLGFVCTPLWGRATSYCPLVLEPSGPSLLAPLHCLMWKAWCPVVGAGRGDQGLHEGTEGPMKVPREVPMKVPREPSILVSEGSTCFKRCGL